MRKCEGCGYLLLGSSDNCNHCGASLPRSEAPALVPVGATMESPFGSPVGAITPPSPPPPLPPSALGRVPVSRDGWTAPAVPIVTQPKRSTSGLLLVCIALLVMVGWVVVEPRVMGNESLPSGTRDYVAGRGVQYSSPDRTFDARFPAQPTVQQKVLSVASSSATLHLAQVQTDDYEVVAASMVLPISLPASEVDAALRSIMREGAGATNGEVLSERAVMVSGVAGIEAEVKVPDGYGARLMVLSAGPCVYMLGVHSKRGTDQLYKALVASFATH